MAHVVAIDEVYLALFAAADKKVGMSRAADGIREDHTTPGTEVGVRNIKRILIEGGKVVREFENIANHVQLDKSIAQIYAAGIRIECAIAGLKEDIAGRIRGWSVPGLPYASGAQRISAGIGF